MSDKQAPDAQHPPIAEQKPHSASYHGTTIEDPYHWLRDAHYPEVETPEILDYLKAENRYFDGYMTPLQNQVGTLFEEMKQRIPADDASVPYLKNGFWYQWRYQADAQYKTWFRAPETDPDNWVVLLDESALAQGKSYFSLGSLSVSPCATKLAYSVDTDGSERYVLHIIDIASGKALTAPITDTIDSPVWNAQSSALLYLVVNDQWQPLEVYCRDLSSADDAHTDRLVYKEADSGFRVSLDLTQSEAYVLIITGAHTSNEVYLLPRQEVTAMPKLMAARQANVEYYPDHRFDAGIEEDEGTGEFVVRSNLRQQNFDLYTVPDPTPEPEHWRLWVSGSEREYITGCVCLDTHTVVALRIDGLSQIQVFDRTNQHHQIKFAEAAYDVDIGHTANYRSDTVRLHYTSMVTPNTVFDYNFAERSLTPRKVQSIPSGYSADQFETRRLMATGRDGVKIPVSMVFHKDTPLDGSAPLYLYAYGAYGYATPPYFSASRLSLLERGFIYAIAHIRGGDDLGYQWYLQGKLKQRTNTFNDFVDVAEHLISEKYCQAGRIAIAGGSAGGELMGAVVNQAPSLWGAVAAHVPFVDVLNTMLDGSLPLTPPEWDEWGNPIEDADAFHHIASYSPYDQLTEGHFPPMLVTAGLNDPRVTYWEPAKYVAKLRTLKQDDNVLLLKTNMGAGHGGQSGRYDSLRELAEEYAFILNELAV